MREPELGKDYLIDFYAILKVERDADAETIHGTYRKMARAYHTDQYQSLAPELKAQADQKMAVLNLAIEILLDPQKRQEYDAQLSEWKGPLSKTGVPIINLDSPFFSSVPLLI